MPSLKFYFTFCQRTLMTLEILCPNACGFYMGPAQTASSRKDAVRLISVVGPQIYVAILNNNKTFKNSSAALYQFERRSGVSFYYQTCLRPPKVSPEEFWYSVTLWDFWPFQTVCSEKRVQILSIFQAVNQKLLICPQSKNIKKGLMHVNFRLFLRLRGLFGRPLLIFPKTISTNEHIAKIVSC